MVDRLDKQPQWVQVFEPYDNQHPLDVRLAPGEPPVVTTSSLQSNNTLGQLAVADNSGPVVVKTNFLHHLFGGREVTARGNRDGVVSAKELQAVEGIPFHQREAFELLIEEAKILSDYVGDKTSDLAAAQGKVSAKAISREYRFVEQFLKRSVYPGARPERIEIALPHGEGEDKITLSATSQRYQETAFGSSMNFFFDIELTFHGSGEARDEPLLKVRYDTEGKFLTRTISEGGESKQTIVVNTRKTPVELVPNAGNNNQTISRKSAEALSRLNLAFKI